MNVSPENPQRKSVSVQRCRRDDLPAGLFFFVILATVLMAWHDSPGTIGYGYSVQASMTWRASAQCGMCCFHPSGTKLQQAQGSAWEAVGPPTGAILFAVQCLMLVLLVKGKLVGICCALCFGAAGVVGGRLHEVMRQGANKGGILALRAHCALLLDEIPL